MINLKNVHLKFLNTYLFKLIVLSIYTHNYALF